MTTPSTRHPGERLAPLIDATQPCSICNTPTSKRCARCKLAPYCSKECQLLAHKRGHPANCVFHQHVQAHSASKLRLQNSDEPLLMNARVMAKELPSFRFTTAEQLSEGVYKTLSLAMIPAAFAMTSILGVSIAQVGDTNEMIAACIQLNGTFVGVDDPIGARGSMAEELLRLLSKLSTAQLMHKSKIAAKGCHAMLVCAPIDIKKDKKKHGMGSTKALLVEEIKFELAEVTGPGMLIARRSPKPTVTSIKANRIGYLMDIGVSEHKEVPLMKVMLPVQERAVGDEVIPLVTESALESVFGS